MWIGFSHVDSGVWVLMEGSSGLDEEGGAAGGVSVLWCRAVEVQPGLAGL